MAIMEGSDKPYVVVFIDGDGEIVRQTCLTL